MRSGNPVIIGVALALGAAAAFGATTPLVKRLGVGAGPFSTAMLLYLGAALFAGIASVRAARNAPFERRHVLVLVSVAVSGAFLAPVLLAWGLQRASGASGSLMLNLEAVFTVVLGLLINREGISPRVWLAMALIAGGGALMVLDRGQDSSAQVIGLAAVAAATMAWALDNTLSRRLAELQPDRVVLGKALLGATLSGGTAWMVDERFPAGSAALGLVACGMIGYGVSLRMYLLAMRRLGSARTGSVFATAPFIGAVIAGLLGDSLGGWLSFAALPLMVGGVYLHMAERHEHEHRHEILEHEHEHRHDDGHHEHGHASLPAGGVHSHRHRHEPMTHAHPHAEDVHHRHH
ncbi:MAG: DMT family transporter [Planctomycetes bacterium]|nr:DMT family transporter [Planctomycetota bacterium]